MESVCKSTVLSRTFISAIKRVHCRGVSTVQIEPQLEDFSVQNEPVYITPVDHDSDLKSVKKREKKVDSKGYLPGSKERSELEAALNKYENQTVDVPIVIGGKEFTSDDVKYQVAPHNHKKKIAKFYYATPDQLQRAIATAMEIREKWDNVPLKEKFDIWLRAADMMSGKYRQDLNATTMLGQSKVIVQAEIDAAAELIDFLRFNAFYAKEAAKWQPLSPEPKSTVNNLRWRGLEGFVAAISPFNFTAIGGNLAYTPAMMGNGVLWKPSDTALLSNYTVFKIMTEAGVPPGVVNFVPSDGPTFGKAITDSPNLAAVNFTGSVPTFQWLWRHVGQNLEKYRNFPRLVGECGGKNYHLVHPTADVTTVVNSTIRSAFEFCGQKCSACSRLYVPESLWPKVKDGLVERQKELKVSDVKEFDSFTSAVIDEKAFKRISGYIDYAKSSPNLSIVAGGKYDNSVGYFVDPTIVQTTDPNDKIMREEIFGPVLSVYVYPDNKVDDAIKLANSSTNFALTGAIFAQDQQWLEYATEKLKNSAGNFYINDKSTGSVVAQQPFGGARLSGTNDKAGGPQYSLKWASPQAVKQTFVPITDVDYPYMK